MSESPNRLNSLRQTVREALHLLGVDKLVVSIHDHSFPSLPDEEIGRGSPYSQGGKRFVEFVSDLGFNAVQLGPQGKTSRTNQSPYDSTIFAKNPLSVSLRSLASDNQWSNLIGESLVGELVKARPTNGHERNKHSYLYAWDATARALDAAYSNLVQRRGELKHLWLQMTLWEKQQEQWLPCDALFEALAEETGTDDWHRWSDVDRTLCSEQTEAVQNRRDELLHKHRKTIELNNFTQFVLHQQHKQFHQFVSSLGLKLYADLQIGFSQRDLWSLQKLFLNGYSLGAPPSRTNPNGQPWGYAVLNPGLYFADKNSRTEGPVLRWFAGRVDKLLSEFDGLRIDHPHGLVCPWVYKTDEADALQAVQNGARLFESPDCPQHPELAAFAIARPEQLNKDAGVPRYADNWVRELSDQQVREYAVLIQCIEQRLVAGGYDPSDLICEVLSSCPYPLQRVFESHNLGRFRVTQKADPANRNDVYRSENAQPNDWVMVGTHDTPPIWQAAKAWSASERQQLAEYLAERLEPNAERRGALVAELTADRLRLIEAMFADLFVGPARNVSIFFADLLGFEETYNSPGVISDTNWLLSVPADYQETYWSKAARKACVSLPAVLAIALRAKFPADDKAAQLIQQLERKSRADCRSHSGSIG